MCGRPRGAPSREVFPERGSLPVIGIPAVPNSLFRRRERTNLSSWHRCLWPRPVLETPFRRAGVAACWPPGRGDNTTHRLLPRCGGGVLRWLERQRAHARRRSLSGVAVALSFFCFPRFPAPRRLPALSFFFLHPLHRIRR